MGEPVHCLPVHLERLHRLFDVLEGKLAQVAQCRLELSGHGIADGARDHDAAGRRLRLQSGCHVHAIAVEVATLDNKIAQMNTDAKYHPLRIGLVGIQLRNCLLEFDRRAQGVHRTRELGQDAVANQLDNASAIPGHGRFQAVAAPFLQTKQRAGLVAAHELGVTNDIRRHDRREFASLSRQRNSLRSIPQAPPKNRKLGRPAPQVYAQIASLLATRWLGGAILTASRNAVAKLQR